MYYDVEHGCGLGGWAGGIVDSSGTNKVMTISSYVLFFIESHNSCKESSSDNSEQVMITVKRFGILMYRNVTIQGDDFKGATIGNSLMVSFTKKF